MISKDEVGPHFLGETFNFELVSLLNFLPSFFFFSMKLLKKSIFSTSIVIGFVVPDPVKATKSFLVQMCLIIELIKSANILIIN